MFLSELIIKKLISLTVHVFLITLMIRFYLFRIKHTGCPDKNNEQVFQHLSVIYFYKYILLLIIN